MSVPFRFTSIIKDAGQIQLLGTAGAGQSYTLEYTRDFGGWSPLGTKTATSTTLQFTDANPADDQRIYRVKSP